MFRRGAPLCKGVSSTCGKRYTSLLRVVNVAALCLLAGCASELPPYREAGTEIDYNRPPPTDWPDLSVEVYDVSGEEMVQACWGLHSALAPNKHLGGCSAVYFCERRCVIYIRHIREELRSKVLDHEQAHCFGYDHPGSTMARDAWARAKAQGCGPQ